MQRSCQSGIRGSSFRCLVRAARRKTLESGHSWLGVSRAKRRIGPWGCWRVKSVAIDKQGEGRLHEQRVARWPQIGWPRGRQGSQEKAAGDIRNPFRKGRVAAHFLFVSLVEPVRQATSLAMCVYVVPCGVCFARADGGATSSVSLCPLAKYKYTQRTFRSTMSPLICTRPSALRSFRSRWCPSRF